MRLARKITTRKAGNRPPASVVEALRRRFPQVGLLWATDVKRWALVQFRKGRPPHLISVLRGRDGRYLAPTVANTVNYLWAIHPSRYTGWAGVRFLDQLDQDEARAGIEAESRNEPLRHELGNLLFNQQRGRIMVPR